MMVNALSLRKKSMDKKNYTYILQCNDGSFYTGWTNNLDRRLKAHNKGNASKYTRSRLPVRLVYYEEYSTKQEAMSREYAIKRLCRKEKIRLIEKYQSEKRKHNDTVTGTSGHNE